ncbi:hypothetical protein [Fimbriiglobus ruber]|uniref:hypothetical protein n=1 Tax=Fimbriiglobus ruber TaxID=1908690 RepID=UPI000B4AC32D|nr:hypothetical protein [Fimbriiglobus ruber]
MRMPPYPVLCYTRPCGQPARFKIAAKWSDGVTCELKTYSLACPDCLAQLLAAARIKQAACRLAPGETLDLPVVYELTPGARDRVLARRADLDGIENSQKA